MAGLWRYLLLAGSLLAWPMLGQAVTSALPAAQSPGSLVVRIQGSSVATAQSMTVWPIQGTYYVSVQNAMEQLGGVVTWEKLTQRALLKGPSGNQAELILGQPQILLNHSKLLRLADVPRLANGQMLISMDTLTILWLAMENQSTSFDPTANCFKVMNRPVLAAVPTRKNQSSPPAVVHGHYQGLVIVDAGHGGKDPGAIGPTRLQEKSVALEVALKLKTGLESLGLQVLLTRANDTFIPLPQRCEIANQSKAVLFISIHANASPNRKASGSEVFIYNREASSRKAAETARYENQDSNYLEIIKDDLRQSIYEEDSITVGGLLARQFTKSGMPIREIERAPFFVLAKSHMPSVLVETAFISNLEEEQKFRTPEFIGRLAGVITAGVEAFFQEKVEKK